MQEPTVREFHASDFMLQVTLSNETVRDIVLTLSSSSFFDKRGSADRNIDSGYKNCDAGYYCPDSVSRQRDVLPEKVHRSHTF